jgi:hypothetical protein
MSVTAPNANSGIPVISDDMYIPVHCSGTALVVNPGDYIIYSGDYAIATAFASNAAKASGLGIATQRNPAYDWAGRPVVNSALIVATRGVFRVTGAASGQVKLGVVAYPVTTGSGVNAASGTTGVGSTWQTAAPSNISANPTGAPNLGVAQLIGCYPALGPAGTGQWDIRMWPRTSDVY